MISTCVDCCYSLFMLRRRFRFIFFNEFFGIHFTRISCIRCILYCDLILEMSAKYNRCKMENTLTTIRMKHSHFKLSNFEAYIKPIKWCSLCDYCNFPISIILLYTFSISISFSCQNQNPMHILLYT